MCNRQLLVDLTWRHLHNIISIFFVFYTMQYDAQNHESMHMRELRRKHGSCWAFIIIILFLLIDAIIIDMVYDTDDWIADGSIILHPIKIHNSRWLNVRRLPVRNSTNYTVLFTTSRYSIITTVHPLCICVCVCGNTDKYDQRIIIFNLDDIAQRNVRPSIVISATPRGVSRRDKSAVRFLQAVGLRQRSPFAIKHYIIGTKSL